MSKNLQALLALVAQFPVRKRIEYENPDDRAFCNQVLIALKNAAPELQAIEARSSSPTWPFVMQFAQFMEAKLALNRHKGDWANLSVNELVDDLQTEVVELIAAINTKEGPMAVRYECADIANFCMMIEDVTTNQSPVRAAGGTPNTVAPSAPETERNSHSQVANPNTADTGASSDQTAGTSGTPASSDARLAAARKAAASSKKPSSPARSKTQKSKAAAAPPATLPATPETATA